jgi:protein phosphatase
VICDGFTVPTAKGEYLLLCSDGLTNVINDQEILFEVLHGGTPDTCCQRLIDIAKHRGAPDNVTSVLIEL